MINSYGLPRLPSAFLSRDRLLDMVDRILSQKLLLIESPHGYGATSLIADWCTDKAERMPDTSVTAIWLNIHEDACGIGSFKAMLYETTEKAFIQGMGDTERRRRDTMPNRREYGIKDYLSLCDTYTPPGHDVVIIIDDLEQNMTEEISGYLDTLINNMPVYLHLILISETMPTLSITFRRVTGQCSIITNRDLAFTDKEIKQYIQLMTKRELARNDVKRIEEITDGWLLGLRLITLCLDENSIVADLLDIIDRGESALVEDFIREALDLISEDDELFLLQVSLLENFTPEMSDTVFVRTDSEERVTSLKSNCFLVFEDNMISCNKLFCRILQRRALCSDKIALEDTLLNIYRWYMDHDEYAHAVRFIIHFELWELLSPTLESDSKHVMEAVVRFLYQDGDLGLNEIPNRVMEDNPYLLTMAAVMYLNKEESVFAEKLLRKASEYVKHDTSSASSEHTEYGQLRRWIKVLLILSKGQQGDEHGGLLLMQDVAEMLREDDPYINSWATNACGLVYARGKMTDMAIKHMGDSVRDARRADNIVIELISSYFLAQCYLSIGKFKRAEEILLRARKSVETRNEVLTPLAGLLDLGLAGICLRHCETEEADRLLYKGTQKLCKGFYVEFYMDTQVILAGVKRIERDPEEAQIILEKAIEAASRHRACYPGNLALCYLAIVQLLSGDIAAAESSLQEAECYLPTTDAGYVLNRLRRFTAVRILISKASYAEALFALDALDLLIEKSKRFEDRITSLILHVLIYSATNREEAYPALEKALCLAAPENLLLPFVEELPSLEPLLRKLDFNEIAANNPIDNELCAEFVMTILGFSGNSEASSLEQLNIGRKDINDMLTKREKDVCHLLISGLTDTEISQRLFISKNTVHVHCNSIYSKLGINSRQELMNMF